MYMYTGGIQCNTNTAIHHPRILLFYFYFLANDDDKQQLGKYVWDYTVSIDDYLL